MLNLSKTEKYQPKMAFWHETFKKNIH